MESTILPIDKTISIRGVKHSNGAYADDLGVIGSTIPELNNILLRLTDNSAEFGLGINLSKTKVMLNAKHDPSIVPAIGN